jgi:glycosyltransferase involved in cell wall biosynthesis
MSVYNCKRYVGEAIKSILAQTYRDFEFLIVDDKSTDGSAAVIGAYARKDERIRVLKNPRNLGLTKSLNRALAAARGEFIARMDADDISEKDRFKKQVAFLESHEGIALVGTCAAIIDGRGRRIGKIAYATEDGVIRRNFVGRSQFVHPSVMFRKSIIKAVGKYDASFRSAQDYEYFSRIMTQFQAANLPDALLRYRWDFSQNEGFISGKRQERNALRARWRMLTRYGWPWWHAIYLAKPLLSYFVPSRLKLLLIRRLYAQA